ncbi:MAG: hypothetical protein GY821_14985 [Gammaproteobacteria bacterium]|nr:hypothetical protein [Gammaproteobacteria bacterium]
MNNSPSFSKSRNQSKKSSLFSSQHNFFPVYTARDAIAQHKPSNWIINSCTVLSENANGVKDIVDEIVHTGDLVSAFDLWLPVFNILFLVCDTAFRLWFAYMLWQEYKKIVDEEQKKFLLAQIIAQLSSCVANLLTLVALFVLLLTPLNTVVLSLFLVAEVLKSIRTIINLTYDIKDNGLSRAALLSIGVVFLKLAAFTFALLIFLGAVGVVAHGLIPILTVALAGAFIAGAWFFASRFFARMLAGDKNSQYTKMANAFTLLIPTILAVSTLSLIIMLAPAILHVFLIGLGAIFFVGLFCLIERCYRGDESRFSGKAYATMGTVSLFIAVVVTGLALFLALTTLIASFPVSVPALITIAAVALIAALTLAISYLISIMHNKTDIPHR